MFALRFSHPGPASRSTQTVPGLRLLGALLVLIVLLGAGISPAMAAREKSGEPVELRSQFDLELPNGNRLGFIPVYADSGRLLGYGIVETMQPETSSYLNVRELRSANPAEIYNALTPPGSAIPLELNRAYGRPELGSQGWALEYDIWFKPMSPCYQPYFDDTFPNFTPNEVISFSDGAFTNSGAWYWDNTTADGDGYDGLSTDRKVGGVASYYAKVVRCKVASVQYPGGPQVRLNGEQAGIPFYVNLGALPDYGATADFAWHPLSPNLAVSWKLTVHTTWPGDEFHIGYAWGALGISP